MKYILFLFIASISFGANAELVSPKGFLPRIKVRTFPPKIGSYETVKSVIARDRRSLKNNNVSLDSTRKYFLHMFENEVFPHWVGTVWDYNGYTNVPGKDKLIACGYFVSTPLKHMGFNWNRFKLAQMYSKKIVETICTDMTKYTDRSTMIKQIKEKEDHLYVVGLDSHVGMMLKSHGQVYFVHSNYIGLEGPVKEIASSSEALSHSASFYLGTFSSDVNMKKWLDGTLFPTE